MKYLKNNAQPVVITIRNQRETTYYDEGIIEDGKVKKKPNKLRVVIGMHRGEMEETDPEVKQFGLNVGQKIVRFFKNEVWQKDKDRIVPLHHSFVVHHYAHIIGFKLGTSIMDEVEYNIWVGQIAKVKDDDDANEIFKRYGFVDEVDEKGTIIRENRWKKDIEVAENRNPHLRDRTMPMGMESFNRPLKTPDEKRVTELEKNEEVG